MSDRWAGRTLLSALVGGVLLGGVASAQEPIPAPTPAPYQPVPLYYQPVPAYQPVPVPHGMPLGYGGRINYLDVWQDYEVSRQGRFRPLVIYSPYGAYYRYNHQPYPWAPVEPRAFGGFIVQ
jgi:hypothetical protein